MPTANLRAIRACGPSWNKGRVASQERPLQPKHVWALRVRLEIAENHRDLALFNQAIDSKLRGCDLVQRRVADVYASAQVTERASIIQGKTQRPVRFEITESTRKLISRWMREPLMIAAVRLPRTGLSSDHGATSGTPSIHKILGTAFVSAMNGLHLRKGTASDGRVSG
ncbi:hypothetical protein [Defluviimonas sp. WL0075]|uniref:hypothetical protein n=1 Tax=Albidovulum sediminicola TaxID=2984331 RepID=UPI0021E98973|nr:hypothetical protein [Defluviimonas sp. WL0075]